MAIAFMAPCPPASPTPAHHGPHRCAPGLACADRTRRAPLGLSHAGNPPPAGCGAAAGQFDAARAAGVWPGRGAAGAAAGAVEPVAGAGGVWAGGADWAVDVWHPAGRALGQSGVHHQDGVADAGGLQRGVVSRAAFAAVARRHGQAVGGLVGAAVVAGADLRPLDWLCVTVVSTGGCDAQTTSDAGRRGAGGGGCGAWGVGAPRLEQF